MKILQLIQKPQLRGAEMFASQLSNNLLGLGHDVQMVSLLDGQAKLPFNGIHIALKRPLKKRFFDWVGWKQLANHVNLFKPDVVQANAGDTLKFAVLSKLFFRWDTPIVFRNANQVSAFIRNPIQKKFNQWLFGNVQHVISVSELCRRDFVATYGYENARTTTVPIGVELNTTQGHNQLPADIKALVGNSDYLVHVASFVPEKNHAGLLRIVNALSVRYPDIKLLLLGDGRLRASIEEQIQELNLGEKVHLLGYRTDALPVISCAVALVLPSTIEGLPGVILEAMLCKTPVIANNVGGISEVVRPGETGWLVEPGDETGFVQAIDDVLQQGSIDFITAKANKLVVHEFNNLAIAKRFLRVYERLY